MEVDDAFYDLVRELLAGRPNLTLLNADVLKNKNEINPDLIRQAVELQQEFGCTRLKLVANLPYAVAVPVIANFLLADLSVERMVVTVQYEIAERLLAQPGSKDYGALTVLVQCLAEVESVRRRLPPAVFWPRPQVASAILLIQPSASKRAHVTAVAKDVQRFRHFLRDLYVHRRKNLRGALAGLPGGRFSKEEVDRKLTELGLDGTLRAESLGPEQHLRLCAVFYGHLGALGSGKKQ
jgi:16S rRNA (adenine1518-N6/adenine1519-N6)-dimethyltransferase